MAGDVRGVVAREEAVGAGHFLGVGRAADRRRDAAPRDLGGRFEVVVGADPGPDGARRDGVDMASIRPSWIQYPGEYNCRDVATGDLAGGTGNCWSYVDVRDVATAVAAALDADIGGHEAFNVAAAENYVGRPTADLVEEQWGELPAECELDDDQSALSTAKAQGLLDWEPEYDWREAVDADIAAPTLTGE